MFYKVHVNHVDGESFITIGTPRAKDALAYLTQLDHEGSSLQMEVFTHNNLKEPRYTVDDSELVYAALRNAAEVEVG